ncbi:MAG TPA: FGGY family carbohydrate kinase [Rhizobiaceae bacterium]|nr:FGGY family carbohydrate kinase [Rhizobiaceae bacterium]
MPRDAILAIDQGTSSTKCLVVGRHGDVLARAAAPLAESCPEPGWVEQDGEQIWASVQSAVAQAMEQAEGARIAAVGFSTQRESLMLWDRRSGAALSPLLSWQDQRTASRAQSMATGDAPQKIRALSGLPLDPMFSALKAEWLLDRFDRERARARADDLALGTVDSWLLAKLGGEHRIEIGNASRTQLLDTRRGVWSDELCRIFNVPQRALPAITPSSGPFPGTRALSPLPDGTPVAAVLGDSHAALFGHGLHVPGAVKATYGTGSSVMGLVGDRAIGDDTGACLTIAWQIGGEKPAHAVEGNIRSAGSTLKWLADIFGLSIDELIGEAVAAPSAGVHLVPAFNGLGAPYWDDEAVALLAGFKLGTRRNALLRAGFESIPHQVADVVEAVERSTGLRIDELHADGGPSANDDLMQLQADLAGKPVHRVATSELSALGAAHLAGLSSGFWSAAELAALPRRHESFQPRMDEAERGRQRGNWRDAVRRSRGTVSGG